MREVTTHKLNGLNDALKVVAIDPPGAGNASHRYEIGGFNADANPSVGKDEGHALGTLILFQNGPVGEAGANGISNEALLAVLIDRLEGFQGGDYACPENAIALARLREAMNWLHFRTKKRLRRGVEGTSAK